MLVCIVYVCLFPREAKRMFRCPGIGIPGNWELLCGTSGIAACALTVEPVLEICFLIFLLLANHNINSSHQSRVTEASEQCYLQRICI